MYIFAIYVYKIDKLLHKTFYDAICLTSIKACNFVYVTYKHCDPEFMVTLGHHSEHTCIGMKISPVVGQFYLEINGT